MFIRAQSPPSIMCISSSRPSGQPSWSFSAQSETPLHHQLSLLGCHGVQSKHISDRMSGNGSNDGDELTFVVTTNPYEKKSAAHKKRVRSVAALKSWPERRKKTFERHGQSNPHIGGFVLDKPEPTVKPNRPTPSTSTTSRSTPSFTDLKPRVEEEPLFEKCTRATNDSCNCIHCRNERRYRYVPSEEQPGQRTVVPLQAAPQGRKRTADGNVKVQALSREVALITPPSSPHTPSPLAMVKNEGRQEPFNCYPVEYHPSFDRILYHSMLTAVLTVLFTANEWQCSRYLLLEGGPLSRSPTRKVTIGNGS